MSISIPLTESDFLYARSVAEERWSMKGGWPLDFAIDSQSEQGVVVTGILGEMAYARFWDVPLDTRVLERGIGDGGVDLQLTGLTVDVKATTRTTGRLILNQRPLSSPHYFSLAIITNTDVLLAGIISSAEFLCKAQQRDFGYGERFFLTQEQLRSPSSILTKGVR